MHYVNVRFTKNLLHFVVIQLCLQKHLPLMLSPFITVYKSLEINKQFFFKLPFCAISLKKRKRKSEENGKGKRKL
jgi:hypothetical protein